MTHHDPSISNEQSKEKDVDPSSSSDQLLLSLPKEQDMNDMDNLEIANSNTGLLPPDKKKIDLHDTLASDYSNWKKYVGVAILFFINLLNYMDRFTIAGVLIQIQEFFHISNAMGGLLQTVFIISYMLVAPLFGYLGDRYNRKVIMVFGMAMWSGFTLLASFVKDPNMFPVFLLLRALVGIGEASYSTIAPTLIGDLFVGQKRTQMLSVFYFAIPVGSGLGYIVGSQAAYALGGWEWALRVTPGLGLLAIFLVIFLCPNPPRGASETNVKVDNANKNSYIEDLKHLRRNKSFILITIGFTFMAFVIGSLTLWGPVFFAYSEIATGKIDPCSSDSCDYTEVNFLFGLITCVAGFAGIGIGAEVARRWKNKGQANADPLVCAVGLILGGPLLFVGCYIAIESVKTAWAMIFLADLSLCLTWTLVGDMTLYVTVPSRRSSANAVMILIAHLFGDAGSPYLIGLLSDALQKTRPDTYLNRFYSLQEAMTVTLFTCIIGCGAFLLASLVIVQDKEKVDNFLKSSSSGSSTTRTTCTDDSHTSIPMMKADELYYHVFENDDLEQNSSKLANGNILDCAGSVGGSGLIHPLLNGKETVI